MKKWCSTCQAHTPCDLDRCATCGMSRHLSVGAVCTCKPFMRSNQVSYVLNARCPAHGAKPPLKVV